MIVDDVLSSSSYFNYYYDLHLLSDDLCIGKFGDSPVESVCRTLYIKTLVNFHINQKKNTMAENISTNKNSIQRNIYFISKKSPRLS